MEQELARQRMLSGRADPAQKLVEGGEAIERTGKQVGVSRETVRQAAKIAEETPDVLKAMASGIVSSMPDALHLAALPKPRRTRILRRIADGGTDFDFRGGKRTFGFSYLRPSQETNEWYAPEQVIEAARTVMGSIELDPASCPQANRRVRAQRIFTVREDGLKKPWKAESLFLNPPFGLVDNESYVGLWIRKLIGEYEAGRTRQALLIVMATVSHRWFRPLWSFPMCVTFKRLKFVRGSPKNTECRPTFGSAIIYFGPEVKRFALEFAHIGRILVPEGEVTRVLNRS
jgi:ParB family chromosome partitioning protein